MLVACAVVVSACSAGPDSAGQGISGLQDDAGQPSALPGNMRPPGPRPPAVIRPYPSEDGEFGAGFGESRGGDLLSMARSVEVELSAALSLMTDSAELVESDGAAADEAWAAALKRVRGVSGLPYVMGMSGPPGLPADGLPFGAEAQAVAGVIRFSGGADELWSELQAGVSDVSTAAFLGGAAAAGRGDPQLRAGIFDLVYNVRLRALLMVLVLEGSA